MLDIGSSELLLIVIVAVVAIGPKDLPRALYKLGQITGKARGMASHFRTGVDAMVREVELEELEKKWAKQNQCILEEHPSAISAFDDNDLRVCGREIDVNDVSNLPSDTKSPPPLSSTVSRTNDGPPYLAVATVDRERDDAA